MFAKCHGFCSCLIYSSLWTRALAFLLCYLLRCAKSLYPKHLYTHIMANWDITQIFLGLHFAPVQMTALREKNRFQCRLSDWPARFGFWEDVCCWKDSVVFVAHSQGIGRLPWLRHNGLRGVQEWSSSADGAPIYLGITWDHLQSGRVEIRSWQSCFGCQGGVLHPPLEGRAGWIWRYSVAWRAPDEHRIKSSWWSLSQEAGLRYWCSQGIGQN